jgi:hypothetical protein
VESYYTSKKLTHEPESHITYVHTSDIHDTNTVSKVDILLTRGLMELRAVVTTNDKHFEFYF